MSNRGIHLNGPVEPGSLPMNNHGFQVKPPPSTWPHLLWQSTTLWVSFWHVVFPDSHHSKLCASAAQWIKGRIRKFLVQILLWTCKVVLGKPLPFILNCPICNMGIAIIPLYLRVLYSKTVFVMHSEYLEAPDKYCYIVFLLTIP